MAFVLYMPKSWQGGPPRYVDDAAYAPGGEFDNGPPQPSQSPSAPSQHQTFKATPTPKALSSSTGGDGRQHIKADSLSDVLKDIANKNGNIGSTVYDLNATDAIKPVDLEAEGIPYGADAYSSRASKEYGLADYFMGQSQKSNNGTWGGAIASMLNAYSGAKQYKSASKLDDELSRQRSKYLADHAYMAAMAKQKEGQGEIMKTIMGETVKSYYDRQRLHDKMNYYHSLIPGLVD